MLDGTIFRYIFTTSSKPFENIEAPMHPRSSATRILWVAATKDFRILPSVTMRGIVRLVKCLERLHLGALRNCHCSAVIFSNLNNVSCLLQDFFPDSWVFGRIPVIIGEGHCPPLTSGYATVLETYNIHSIVQQDVKEY